MKLLLDGIQLSLNWALILSLGLSSPRGWSQPRVPEPTPQQTYQELYNSITLEELEALNLDLAELLRRSHYWGTPGSTQVPPSSAELNRLSSAIQKWKQGLELFLPEVLSVAHPKGEDEIDREALEVSFFYEAAKQLELIKYLNREGAPLQDWQRLYSLEIPLSKNADYNFIDQMSQIKQEQLSKDSAMLVSLNMDQEPLLSLQLNPALIEEFEMKQMGRFQTQASAVDLIQLAGVSLLYDNLAELHFLLDSPEQLPDIEPFWLEKFPVLRHKKQLWEKALDSRQQKMSKTQFLKNRLSQAMSPLLEMGVSSENFAYHLATDLFATFGLSYNEDNIRPVQQTLHRHLIENGAFDLGALMPALVQLWDLPSEQIGEEFHALAVEAIGQFLRHRLLRITEEVVPNTLDLSEAEYNERIGQLRSAWRARIEGRLDEMFDDLTPSHFNSVTQWFSERPAEKQSLQNDYLQSLERQAKWTEEVVQGDGPVDLSILNQVLMSEYHQAGFSASAISTMSQITSQAEYANARDFYFEVLITAMPDSSGPKYSGALTAEELRDWAESHPNEQRSKNLHALIKAGEWLGFFKFQNHQDPTPSLSDLDQLPEAYAQSYLQRLELLSQNLQPILNVTIADPEHPGTVPKKLTLRQTLTEEIPFEQKHRFVQLALIQTQHNVKHYLQVLKEPYERLGFISSLLSSASDKKEPKLNSEFLSIIRYSVILQTHLQQHPQVKALASSWLKEASQPNQLEIAWAETEHFLFDRALWVLLGLQLAMFLARLAPASRLGSLIGWMFSTILAPVFGQGAIWMHTAILSGLAVILGVYSWSTFSLYLETLEVEKMLQTTAFDNSLTDSTTYLDQYSRFKQSGQQLLVFVGVLAAVFTLLAVASHFGPRLIAKMRFKKFNSKHKELFETLGIKDLKKTQTRSEIEAAYHATASHLRALPGVGNKNLIAAKFKLRRLYGEFINSINSEARYWNAKIRNGYRRQIQVLALDDAAWMKNLGITAETPITPEIIKLSQTRLEAYYKSGRISAFEWARVQDSARQLLAGVKMRQSVWSDALLFGDAENLGRGFLRNDTLSWTPERMNFLWEKESMPLRFETFKMNGMEFFRPVRTDLTPKPQPPKLLESPTDRKLLTYTREEPLKWK